jgi:hypothetical protein
MGAQVMVPAWEMCASVLTDGVVPLVLWRPVAQMVAVMEARVIQALAYVRQAFLEQLARISPVPMIALAMEVATRVNVDAKLHGLGRHATFN